MAEVYAFAGRGGTGKSTCTKYIACALAEASKKVLVIDFDVKMRMQDILFGIENDVVYNFYDAAQYNCDFYDAVVSVSDKLDVMCAPQSVYIDEIDFECVTRFIGIVKNNYDYVLIDCPASLSLSTEKIFAMCDAVVVVSDCTLGSAKAADVIATVAEKCKCSKNYLIVNKIDVDISRKNDMINIEDVLDIAAVTPIGAVPYDKNLFGKKKSPSKKAFANIALRITGEKVPVLYVKKKGLF